MRGGPRHNSIFYCDTLTCYCDILTCYCDTLTCYCNIHTCYCDVTCTCLSYMLLCSASLCYWIVQFWYSIMTCWRAVRHGTQKRVLVVIRVGLGNSALTKMADRGEQAERIRNHLSNSLTTILRQLESEHMDVDGLDCLLCRLDWLYNAVVRYLDVGIVDERIVDGIREQETVFEV